MIPTPPFPPLLVVMGVSGSRQVHRRRGRSPSGSGAVRRRRRLPPARPTSPRCRPARRSTTTTAGPWLRAIGAWLAEHADRAGWSAARRSSASYRDLLRAGAARRRLPAPARRPATSSPPAWPAARGTSCPPRCSTRSSPPSSRWRPTRPGSARRRRAGRRRSSTRYLPACPYPDPTVPRTTARADVPGAVRHDSIPARARAVRAGDGRRARHPRRAPGARRPGRHRADRPADHRTFKLHPFLAPDPRLARRRRRRRRADDRRRRQLHHRASAPRPPASAR